MGVGGWRGKIFTPAATSPSGDSLSVAFHPHDGIELSLSAWISGDMDPVLVLTLLGQQWPHGLLLCGVWWVEWQAGQMQVKNSDRLLHHVPPSPQLRQGVWNVLLIV